MMIKTQSAFCIMLMLFSALAGCLESNGNTEGSDDSNDMMNDDGNMTNNSDSNNTENNTDNIIGNNTDNNTDIIIGNNTENNTDNNMGNNTDNNNDQSNQPCNYSDADMNATDLPNGACCSSGGQCASSNCNYSTWTCEAWDTDGDSMPDYWEDQYGLDRNDSSDSLDDPDNDGLNNLQEAENNTNPNNADTDGDGYIDSEDPNPNYADITDSDGDGWSDEEEITCDTDPYDSSSTPADANSDGVCDAFEYLTAGTNETTYVAWFDDATMVQTTLITENLSENITYTLTWYLNKSIDGDDIPDINLEEGEFTITNSNGQQELFEFLIHGPNTAFGLTEGWHCVHADLKQPSNGVMITIESDDACFDVISPQDYDQDGYNSTTDCDDNNADINPGAEDVWNNIDDNCNSIIDEYQTRLGNASLELDWNTVGWYINNGDANYLGHEIYWLPGEHRAYRFLASQDQVFDWGNTSAINNFVNALNVETVLSDLGMDNSNLTISMTTMDLGTDTEGVEWSYDQNTHVETRHYSGGNFIILLDGEPILESSVGFTEYLNYSQYFSGTNPNPQVTMNGTSNVAQVTNLCDGGNCDANQSRIAGAFCEDFNGLISFTFISQEAIIQTEYEETQAEAIQQGVVTSITNLLVNGADWIGAQFNEFTAQASSED